MLYEQRFFFVLNKLISHYTELKIKTLQAISSRWMKTTLFNIKLK